MEDDEVENVISLIKSFTKKTKTFPSQKNSNVVNCLC